MGPPLLLVSFGAGDPVSEPQALSSGSWSPSTQCEEVMGQEGGAPDGVGTGKEGGQVRPTLAHRAKVGGLRSAPGANPICALIDMMSDVTPLGLNPRNGHSYRSKMGPPATLYRSVQLNTDRTSRKKRGCSLWV